MVRASRVHEMSCHAAPIIQLGNLRIYLSTLQCKLEHNTYRNSEPNLTNTNLTPVTTATTPYIKRTSQTVPQILRPCNIRVVHKPITTLRQLLTNIKDRDKPSDRQGAVYKIKCCDFDLMIDRTQMSD